MGEQNKIPIDPRRSRVERRFTGVILWPIVLWQHPWVEVSDWGVVAGVTVAVVFLPAVLQFIMERQPPTEGERNPDKKGYPAFVGCSTVILRWVLLYALVRWLPGFGIEGTFGPILIDLMIIAISLPFWVMLARMRRRPAA